MDAITYNEFPFVADLPKREKTKLEKAWDSFLQLKAASEKHGTLLPQVLCAEILGVSKQRISQFIQSGQLMAVGIAGRQLVTEDSFLQLARTERRNGRPLKTPSLKDCARISKEI